MPRVIAEGEAKIINEKCGVIKHIKRATWEHIGKGVSINLVKALIFCTRSHCQNCVIRKGEMPGNSCPGFPENESYLTQDIPTPGENTLKIFCPKDAPVIFALIDRNRDHLSRPGEDTVIKYPTEESVLNSITNPQNKNRLRYGIWNSQGVYVGSINFTPDEDRPGYGEIGYYIGQEFTGKGYATDAVIALTQFVQSHGYPNPYARVLPHNKASVRVMQKAGFVTDGIIHQENRLIFTL